MAGALSGNPGIGAGFAVAVDANWSKAAPAINGNPSSAESNDAGGAAGSWRLVGSTAATAKAGAAPILHTADIERSDPRLAGLMLRREKQAIEAVVGVVEPFPPRARPQITLRTPGQDSQFIGAIIPAGAGFRLAGDAAGMVTGPWRTAPEIEIRVAGGGAAIDASPPYRACPSHSNRSTPNVSKNETLRDRALGEISYRKTSTPNKT